MKLKYFLIFLFFVQFIDSNKAVDSNESRETGRQLMTASQAQQELLRVTSLWTTASTATEITTFYDRGTMIPIINKGMQELEKRASAGDKVAIQTLKKELLPGLPWHCIPWQRDLKRLTIYNDRITVQQEVDAQAKRIALTAGFDLTNAPLGEALTALEMVNNFKALTERQLIATSQAQQAELLRITNERDALRASEGQLTATSQAQQAELSRITNERNALRASEGQLTATSQAQQAELLRITNERNALRTSEGQLTATSQAQQAELLRITNERDVLRASEGQLMATSQAQQAELLRIINERDALRASEKQLQELIQELIQQTQGSYDNIRGLLYNEDWTTEEIVGVIKSIALPIN